MCAVAEATARRVTAGTADLRLVDIDADPELYQRYTVRVPVIEVEGREIAEFEIREEDLRTALRRADAGPSAR